jgi:hypothetical protein
VSNDQQNRTMTDHLHLINQVAHHDAALGAFGSRMTAVEGTLAHVQDKVNNLDVKVGAGFGNLESLIREGKATQGPTLGDLLKGVATGGAIIAMSAGAITMLVTSFVKPELVELRAVATETRTEADALRRAEEKRIEADRAELMALQERRRQMIDDKFEMLTERAFKDWSVELKRGDGS